MKRFYCIETENKLFAAENYEQFRANMIKLGLVPDAVFDMFPTQETYDWYELFNNESTTENPNG